MPSLANHLLSGFLLLSVALGVRADSARADSAPAQALDPVPPPAAGQTTLRSAVPVRRLVQGRWSEVQMRLRWSDLLKVEESEGMTMIVTRPSPRVEPQLKGGRIALVEVEGSALAWMMSAVGRVWADDTRQAGSQHLQLVGRAEDIDFPSSPTVSRVHITPQGAVVEGVCLQADQRKRIMLVIASSRCDLAIQPLETADPNQWDWTLHAPTVRSMMRQHAQPARDLMVPLLRELSEGKVSLAPLAGDVYRAFSDVPLDDKQQSQVRETLKQADDPDPRVREGVLDRLRQLGRGGVGAAMKMDRTGLSPGAGAMLDALIHEQSEDDRDPAVLLADRFFLTDCTADPDPRIAAAARKRLDALKTP